MLLFVLLHADMGSPWEHLPTDVAREVMEHLKWDRGTSEVFRQVCKGWRDSHDRSATRLRVTGDSLPSSCILMTRFQILKEIGVRFDSGPRFASTFQRTFASLTALTSLDLARCEQVSDNGLHTLGGLTALTSLNVSWCYEVSGDGLRALSTITALTDLMWMVSASGSAEAVVPLWRPLNLRRLPLPRTLRVAPSPPPPPEAPPG